MDPVEANVEANTMILQATNPLEPSALEWVYLMMGLVHLALLLALILWLPRQRRISPGARLAGVLVAFVLQLLGPLLVWAAARRGIQSPDRFSR